MRLVPALWISCLIEYYTVSLGSAMDIGLLLITLSRVRLDLLAMNPRDKLTVSIYHTSLLILLLLGGGIMGSTRRAPPVILVLQGP